MRGRLPVDDPELEPQHARAGGNGLLGVRHAQLRAAEDIDHVEAARRGDRLGQCSVGRHAEDIPLVRVDRDALEALLDQVAEDT